MLAAEFQSEREVKENADKIEINTTTNTVVIEANTPSEESKKFEAEEVIIKNVFTAPIMEPVKEKEPEPVKEEIPVVASDSVEEQPEPEPEETKEVETEPEVAEAAEEPAEEKNGNVLSEPRIIGKIDLDAINSKTSPGKKSKNQKNAKKTAKAANNNATPNAAEAANQKAKKVEPKPEPTPKVEEKPAEPQPQEKTVEFIQTEYQKLEGLKVVSKIDLTQFNKPKSEGEKKKRKRIKKEGVRVTENGTEPANNKNGKQGKNGNQNQPAKEKKPKAKQPKKVEIDDNEIEKQIRDTLARLSPMGKSKTSKHNREKRQKVHQRIEEEQLNEMENSKTLQVTEFVTANELATMMSVPVTQIISTCMSVGIFVSINQRLDAETIKLIADEFGFDINFASADVVDELNKIEEEDRPEDLVPRNPIITVMGHVDHGKTSLLDYIRKTNVIAGEAGGITQHIGAYEVTTAEGRKITFLDTPGHEAFTAMRARGAKVTDIAIIVIAADDKVMPQTIEAINHAQAAGVPIVFAINKIDRPGADPDKIKTELAQMNLLVEEWGGKYQSQDISAKKGINVEELLEKVILQADIMELKGNPNKRAKGTVLESSLDKGRGYVAKLLVEDGTIRKGDPIVAGAISGRVRAMYNERNQEVVSAGPSQPVLLLGLNGACQAGDTFNVMENEKEAKDIANKRTQLQREQGLRTQTHVTLDGIQPASALRQRTQQSREQCEQYEWYRERQRESQHSRNRSPELP